MTTCKRTLGFIGIGLMGKPLVLRLLASEFKVNVWNRSAEKLEAVTAVGAQACNDVAQLVQRSDIIILCLADTAAVEAVVLSEGGIAAHGAADKLLIDLSSIHPHATRRLAAQLYESCGMGWVDAPVSGGVSGAEQGTLAIMAGGSEGHVETAKEVLAPLCKRFTHMGEVGCGQITKICNQMIVACNALTIAEMIALAKRTGVAPEKIPAALQGGFADSKPLQILGPEMAEERFEPVKWRVKTLLKDLNMAVDIAVKHGGSVPLSGLAAQLMQLHAAKGYLEQDPATLIKLYSSD